MLSVQGIDLDRSTLAFWVGYAAAELMPVYERLKQTVLCSPKLAVDETPIPVLDPGRGKTKTGYFWTMARDDRPWGGSDPPAVLYTYAPGRGGEHLHDLLAGYRGIVQCDGYAPYKNLPKDRIAVAFCWAHLRREFFDIAKGRDAPIAEEALLRIAQLYEIEKAIRGRSADQRCAVRQQNAAPLVEAFKTWLELQLSRVSGKAKSQAPSDTASDTGMASSAFSTTDASSSIPTSSSAPCGLRRSPARTPSSPAATTAPRVGPSTPR